MDLPAVSHDVGVIQETAGKAEGDVKTWGDEVAEADEEVQNHQIDNSGSRINQTPRCASQR